MIKENYIKLYEDSFRRNWDLPCLTEYPTQTTMTYGDFASEIALTHLLFESIGIKQGDKIALCGRDSAVWVTAFMATITYGATIVPILSDFNPVDITHIINHSEAELLFVSENIWEHIEFDKLLNVKGVISLNTKKLLAEVGGAELKNKLRLLRDSFEEKYKGGFKVDDIKYPFVDNDSLLVLNYTSGTTGFSKGVMLTANNLAGNVVFGINSKLHFRGSRALSFLPLAHAYGCAFDMLTPLATGSHITLLCKTPSPKILLKALSEVRPNLIICVPLILEKVYKNQILPMISKGAVRWALAIPFLDTTIYSKIRRKLIDAFGGCFEEVIVGGAPLNKEVEAFLYKIKFPFTVGYGMTECAPLISYTPWREFEPESSGRTLPDIMESKIESSDPEHIEGEICVRGENVMTGYYKNEDATKAVIDAQGWLHTGDMGTRSADGTIFIRGRYKTMILTANGQNIYPEEIESKLNNMPFVAESLVIERDRRLVALVYPDYDAVDRMGLAISELDSTMEKIRGELNKIVAPYEKIDKITLVPNEFEKTPKRSIKRYLYSQ